MAWPQYSEEVDFQPAVVSAQHMLTILKLYAASKGWSQSVAATNACLQNLAHGNHTSPDTDTARFSHIAQAYITVITGAANVETSILDDLNHGT